MDLHRTPSLQALRTPLPLEDRPESALTTTKKQGEGSNLAMVAKSLFLVTLSYYLPKNISKSSKQKREVSDHTRSQTKQNSNNKTLHSSKGIKQDVPKSKKHMQTTKGLGPSKLVRHAGLWRVKLYILGQLKY